MGARRVIGSRGSALALWQARHVQGLLKPLGLESEIRVVKTKGDKILDVPLAKIGGKGLFTKELEILLLEGEIDLAVHSLKDVPVDLPKGLVLACVSARANPQDCFLSYKYPNLQALPPHARVGTTSLRRAMQLKIQRADLDPLSLRGNVQRRLERLQEGDFEAVILACAGVERLGIELPYQVRLGLEEMIPSMGQGALGIEMRADHPILDQIFSLNDPDSALCCGIERDFVRALGGGCQVPLGVHARLLGEQIEIRAIVGLLDGKSFIKERVLGVRDRAEVLVQDLVKTFKQQGASEILAQTMLQDTSATKVDRKRNTE
ncbi:hydroxymethylbilane synthase [Helicobacter labacensis]|uniref:hydroxymethylbilane synthase n=1 Tax=Helicobacter labacensis TaxID=2316079 RepID=UPI000EB122DE|nr:hydroxymethylbilane synthase [Helicobacter labacensis]